VTLVTTGVFTSNDKATSALPVDEVDLEVATLEQAALEMMYLVPNRQSYEEAFQVMESLTSLRPQVVQQLLEECTSVKTKRLFMHAAERSNHPWLRRLDLSQVDFGSGRRTIHAGGRLDNKYGLVVAGSRAGLSPGMAARDRYRGQVEHLIRCLPAIASAPDFAITGGTAINLLLRDMPRSSVDIDLTAHQADRV
jgi:hypothetical protein